VLNLQAFKNFDLLLSVSGFKHTKIAPSRTVFPPVISENYHLNFALRNDLDSKIVSSRKKIMS